MHRDISDNSDDLIIIRWVILTGTLYEKQINEFSKRINTVLNNHHIKVEIVRSTGSCIGQLLFNNREKFNSSRACLLRNCDVCTKNLRPDSNQIISKINGRKYYIDANLNCGNWGIYRVSCPCDADYSGKTTTSFGRRFNEHFQAYRESSVLDHSKVCTLGRTKEQYSIQFLENCFSRGKYTLSEREYLWHTRLGGVLNVQKVLRN